MRKLVLNDPLNLLKLNKRCYGAVVCGADFCIILSECPNSKPFTGDQKTYLHKMPLYLGGELVLNCQHQAVLPEIEHCSVMGMLTCLVLGLGIVRESLLL